MYGNKQLSTLWQQVRRQGNMYTHLYDSQVTFLGFWPTSRCCPFFFRRQKVISFGWTQRQRPDRKVRVRTRAGARANDTVSRACCIPYPAISSVLILPQQTSPSTLECREKS
uniref:Uncharacterized protein n=1 Tax=Anguilla anguilla TaxID=7936 RepID=A0A0E9WRH7_ANGAN